MSNEKFIKYLDTLNECIEIYKSLSLATEIMGELPLTEEQIEAINILLESMQSDWKNQFVELLEYGVNQLKDVKGDDDDRE